MTAAAGGEAPRRRVRVLPDDLANKIAAGEVVERPASVVKELCENALDAGATRIDVEVDGGGVNRIAVTDDGVGMTRDDLLLSVTRHATSKIAGIEDLTAIGSFGFRGEALPSIASVSRFKIASRAREEELGHRLVWTEEGPRAEPEGMPQGTRVELEDLFFNVPARRKFLRALATEAAQVTEVVDGIALGHPQVTVTLERDGRKVRQHLRAATREERVKTTLVGWELARCVGRAGPLAVEAYLSRPEKARSGATGLWVFVNGRPVQNRALARAVAHAYGSVLEPGRYPVGVAYLDLPFELVDVNVHPQKSEVRFADGRAVQDALCKIVQSALGIAFTNQLALGGSAPAPQPKPTTGTLWSGSGSLAPLAPTLGAAAQLPPPIPYPTQPSDVPLVAADEREPKEDLRLEFLAQARGMYLVCEAPDGLVIIDQHAAAERVTFDRLKRAWNERKVSMQTLLLPEIVDVRPSDVALVEAASEEIYAMGLDLRAAGTSRVSVHAVPQLLARANPRDLALSVIAELGRSGARDFSGAIDLSLATMACHGSIRAGDRVSAAEAKELLQRLREIEFAGHCPHGRPILMRLPFRELDQRVGRR